MEKNQSSLHNYSYVSEKMLRVPFCRNGQFGGVLTLIFSGPPGLSAPQEGEGWRRGGVDGGQGRGRAVRHQVGGAGRGGGPCTH